MEAEHKAAFISIIGKPNVGKSTLMNALINASLSITNPKAQTTRHRIRGIKSEPHYQLVFSDTPGMMDPAYKLQETMMGFVYQSLEDADILMCLMEPEEPLSPMVEEVLDKTDIPIVLVINKVDKSDDAVVLEKIAQLSKRFPSAEVVPVSALKNYNTDHLEEVLVKLSPQHPAYFDKDQLSDKTDRFFISEIIREKILKLYKKEIPYSVEVVVENYKEEEKIHRIEAVVYVERDSQKIIVIGKGGDGIKRLGTMARKHIEEFLGGQHVFLDLRVKVRKNWRSDDLWLKRFGYDTE
jgi:GTP-binding protein Era